MPDRKQSSSPPQRLRDLPIAEGATLNPQPAHDNAVSFWHNPARPRIVGMVGWLLLAAGYLGFLLKGSQLPSYFMDMKWLNPDWRPMPFTRGQHAIAVTFLLAEMALALLALAAGIGVLKMRLWGRRAVLWYVLIALALTLLKTAWQISMFDFMLDFQAATTTQPFDRETMGNRSFFAMLVMTAVQITWCAILGVLMFNNYVRDAFAKANGKDVSDWRTDQSIFAERN